MQLAWDQILLRALEPLRPAVLGLLTDCQRALEDMDAEYRSTKAAQAVVVEKIQEVAFDLEGRYRFSKPLALRCMFGLLSAPQSFTRYKRCVRRQGGGGV